MRSRLSPLWNLMKCMSMLASWLPMIVLIGVWIFFMRQMQSGAERPCLSVRAGPVDVRPVGHKVTFDDVAGIEEAKEELSIVEFLREPKKFTRLGDGFWRALLMGPPGTGKTRRRARLPGRPACPFSASAIGFCGDVCRRRGIAGPGSVRSGKKNGAVHNFYR